MSNIDKQQIRSDIAIRKSMPSFSVSPDHSLARLRAIQETQRSFGLGVVEALLDELEAKDKRIAELEVRAFNPALLDVISERQRQRAIEGWTSEHDDAYQNSELADAAACYAINAHNQGFSTPAHWPWAPDWWKQSGPRRDLVKAGALILAEIERLDRAAGKGEAS
ncbi:ead/Ea22-like family protein [Enterobacter sp. DNB-S2]|uniref:ead/Ea22-like family protein n=1 Tax=Enterobacter sp. DNB-S2 TaxID=2720029 RepID=UPI001C633975|nr:ead/Ea22-like family protein [Enterobacter sp. DNB-S2]QYH18064.1 ead/Ea22-like family protein [Enterobacter sp. DNB-S2]